MPQPVRGCVSVKAMVKLSRDANIEHATTITAML